MFYTSVSLRSGQLGRWHCDLGGWSRVLRCMNTGYLLVHGLCE